jgi:ankyrin repeat protein
VVLFFFGRFLRVSVEAIDALVKAGANVDAKLPNAQTALHTSLLNEFADAANYLLDAGADIHATLTNTGSGALLMAVLSGNLQIVKRLIEAGANVNAVNHKGLSVLHYALAGQCPPAIIRELENAGAKKEVPIQVNNEAK